MMEAFSAVTSSMWQSNVTTEPNATEVYNTTIDMMANQEGDPELPTAFLTFQFSVRMLWTVFAIFGNVLTIVAVACFESLQNNTNYLICSLAVADLLGGTVTPMVIAHHLLKDKPIFIPLCLVEKTISALSTLTNLVSISWIAIDRFIFIAHPLHYPMWVTPRRTFYVITISWILSITEVVGLFSIGANLKMGMTCKLPVFLSNLVFNQIFVPQIFVFAFITLCFYVAICRIAYKQGQAIAALNQSYNTHEATTNPQQKRIAKMMITVLGTYFACYLPQIAASIILNSKRTVFNQMVERGTVLIYWANIWLNPVIYAWKSKDFKVAFRKLLRLKPPNEVCP